MKTHVVLHSSYMEAHAMNNTMIHRPEPNPVTLRECLNKVEMAVAPDGRTAPQRLEAMRRQIAVWWLRRSRRAKLRRHLAEMDTAVVESDIGVPRGTLMEEAYRPFWKE